MLANAFCMAVSEIWHCDGFASNDLLPESTGDVLFLGIFKAILSKQLLRFFFLLLCISWMGATIVKTGTNATANVTN